MIPMAQPKNILLSGFPDEECEEFIRQGFDVSVWIRAPHKKNSLAYNAKVETYLHSEVRAFDFSPIKDVQLPADLKRQLRKTTFDTFRRHFFRNNFLEYSNLRSWNNLDNFFYMAANFFYDLLMRKKIDFVILSNVPHEGAFVILFGLAKLLNIPTVMFFQSNFPNRIWAMTDVEDFGEFSTLNGHNLPIPLPKAPEQPFYMRFNIKKDYARKYRKAVTFQILKVILMSITLLAFINRNRYFRNLFRLHGISDRYQLVSQYASKQEQIDLNLSYVYFPLGLQPEMTTDTIGLEYGDQLLAIEEISTSLPDGMLLYVKENPKQTLHMRSESFFRRLSAMTNVRYIVDDVSSYELIKNAKCVAQVTGTAGYEAVLMGVPAITFGATWYNSLYGVFPWKNKDTIEQALEFLPNLEKLEVSFDLLSRKSYIGLIDHNYKTLIDKYDKKEAITQSVKTIREIIDAY